MNFNWKGVTIISITPYYYQSNQINKHPLKHTKALAFYIAQYVTRSLYRVKCLPISCSFSYRGRISRRLSRIFQLPNGNFWITPTWDLARDIIVVHRIKTHGKLTRLTFCFYVWSLVEIKEEMLNSLIYLDRNTCFICLFYKSMLVKFDLLTIR